MNENLRAWYAWEDHLPEHPDGQPARDAPACRDWELPGAAPGWCEYYSPRTAIKLWHGGRCAACGNRPGNTGRRRALVVDHCHDSGMVRGMLCQSCNLIEGHRAAPLLAAYRDWPPAVILGFTGTYVNMFGEAAEPHPAFLKALGPAPVDAGDAVAYLAAAHCQRREILAAWSADRADGRAAVLESLIADK